MRLMKSLMRMARTFVLASNVRGLTMERSVQETAKTANPMGMAVVVQHRPCRFWKSAESAGSASQSARLALIWQTLTARSSLFKDRGRLSLLALGRVWT